MKINKILLILILIFGVMYFALDRQLFFYGKNDFNLYHLLPLKIKPEFKPDFEGGFFLNDESDFAIIGKGFVYKSNDSVKVSKILKYGFNNEKLIALIEDMNGMNYYVEFLSSNENQIQNKITINVWDKNKAISTNKYKWIELKSNEKHIRKVELSRNYMMTITIILLLILTYRLFKLTICFNCICNKFIQ